MERESREREWRDWGSRGRREDGSTDKYTTVFVDNLPSQIRKIWIFNLFSRFGKIRNIFIPNKKSKIIGQNFAFVRFLRIEDAKAAISNIKDSWYWNHKLVAKFPSFLRKEDVQNSKRSPIRNPRDWMQNTQHNQGTFNNKCNHWKQYPQLQPFKGSEMFQQSKLPVKKGPQNQQKFTEEKKAKKYGGDKG